MSKSPMTNWDELESLIARNGFTIDRPTGSAHSRYPDWIYPVDYGSIPGTVGADGAEIDIFVGTSSTGLTGVLRTRDDLKNDREIKLLWNVSEIDVSIIVEFLRRGGLSVRVQLREPQNAP